MKLLICLITYNRLEYTKKTLDYLLDTIQVPHYIIVVDNNSSDGTKLWLADQRKAGRIDNLVINDKNYYPGKACNIGWKLGLAAYPQATHLMRLDNDFVLKKGWDKLCEKYFKKIPRLGQLGLDYSCIDNDHARGSIEEHNGMTINPWPGNVGGVNIIPKKLWDEGIRYNEDPWTSMEKNVPTPQEDCRLSQDIVRGGYLMGHITEPLAWTFADETNWKDYPEYYTKTMTERGYDFNVEKIK